MLEQAERPLGGEVVAEDAVPAGEDLQGARPVEVQEVDVRHVAAGDALGEVEHEALFHRPAGEAVEAAQRDGHEHADDGEAEPRAEGARATAGAARPSHRARTPSGRRGRRSALRPGRAPRGRSGPGRSSVSGSTMARDATGGHHARGRTGHFGTIPAGDRDPGRARDASRGRSRAVALVGRSGPVVGDPGRPSSSGCRCSSPSARLHGRPWHPVLDLAMTEFRVRDVFTSHTPLIGLPGRIGSTRRRAATPGR